jgi:hypothetical protein
LLLAACFTLHSINATLAIVPQRGAGLWIELMGLTTHDTVRAYGSGEFQALWAVVGDYLLALTALRQRERPLAFYHLLHPINDLYTMAKRKIHDSTEKGADSSIRNQPIY